MKTETPVFVQVPRATVTISIGPRAFLDLRYCYASVPPAAYAYPSNGVHSLSLYFDICFAKRPPVLTISPALPVIQI